MTTLNDVLRRPSVSLADVHAHLDALSPDARVREATQLDRKLQSKLWEVAASAAPVTFDDLVPPTRGTFEAVPFEGQNDQPLFRNFRKIFYKTPSGALYGRNDSPVAGVVGHGYYSVVSGGPDGVYIDYTKLPSEKPATWPSIARNDRGLSTVVYGFMKDYLRRVHGRIFIGQAKKPVIGAMGYFVLARPD